MEEKRRLRKGNKVGKLPKGKKVEGLFSSPLVDGEENQAGRKEREVKGKGNGNLEGEGEKI